MFPESSSCIFSVIQYLHAYMHGDSVSKIISFSACVQGDLKSGLSPQHPVVVCSSSWCGWIDGNDLALAIGQIMRSFSLNALSWKSCKCK